MAENYDEYITKAHERVNRFRLNKPEQRLNTEREYRAKKIASKAYHCSQCGISFITKHSLEDHEKTPKHARKLQENKNSSRYCKFCKLQYGTKSNYNRHLRNERHQRAVEEYERRVNAELAEEDAPELDVVQH